MRLARRKSGLPQRSRNSQHPPSFEMESVSSSISYCRLLTCCKKDIMLIRKCTILGQSSTAQSSIKGHFPKTSADISLCASLLPVSSRTCMKTYQVRIGPMAFEGSRHLGDNKVIHLLSGLWMISEAGKFGRKQRTELCFNTTATH